MRRSELAPRAAVQLASLCGAPATLLAIGVTLDLSTCAVTRIARPEDARGSVERFSAAVWAVTGELQSGLRALRDVLAPSARLVLASPVRPSPLDRVRALVSRERIEDPTLDELCTALLLAGYGLPRVHEILPGVHVVSAELPQRLDELDAVFAQPHAGERR